MNSTAFNPKDGLLQLSFLNGTSYSINLSNKYHREEGFFVDLFWEETDEGLSLSLALHPKAGDLIIGSCNLEWSLPSGFPHEIFTQGFSSPLKSDWRSLQKDTPTSSFLKNRAAKKVNAYDPLPHPTLKKASYQTISLRDNQSSIKIKSTDESAALTVFTISKNGTTLCAENQSSGYHLRHSFPAFELLFVTDKARTKSRKLETDSIFSIGISPACVKEGKLDSLMESSFFSEGNLRSVVLQQHDTCCPGGTGFDESLFSAFAKTCFHAQLLAGISLNPFILPVDAATNSLKLMKKPRYKRWSPSLRKYVYPIEIHDEDSMRSCEQHLLRYYQMGYRYFVLHDVTASLREGLESSTTGQQLNKRLNMLRRVLPNATVLLDDLCPADVFTGFQGFREKAPQRAKLPRLARLTRLGSAPLKPSKLNPFLIPQTAYATLNDSGSNEVHKLLDLTGYLLTPATWISLETTVGIVDYPISAVDAQ